MKVQRDKEFNQLEETAIWEKFRKGNQSAFACIFKNYNPLLYHYGIKFFKDEVLVEDSIQDLFLELWRSKENLAEVKSVKYYLIVSLRRILLRKLKAEKSQMTVSSNSFLQHSLEEEEAFETVLIRIQAEEAHETRLAHAIEMLPPRQKEAVVLKFFHNRSYPEIMEMMGINYQTARKIVYKAVQNLRTHFQQSIPVE